MFDRFHLTALIGETVYRIPLQQDLQRTLSAQWAEQLSAFVDDSEEVDFDPGYKPESHERLRLADFALPEHLAALTSAAIPDLPSIHTESANFAKITAIIAFVRLADGSLPLADNGYFRK